MAFPGTVEIRDLLARELKRKECERYQKCRESRLFWTPQSRTVDLLGQSRSRKTLNNELRREIADDDFAADELMVDLKNQYLNNRC